jgi:hypothetical protein
MESCATIVEPQRITGAQCIPVIYIPVALLYFGSCARPLSDAGVLRLGANQVCGDTGEAVGLVQPYGKVGRERGE